MGLLNQILNLANSQLGKTRNDFLSDNPPQEWCAWFITWLAKKTNCTSIPQSISCTEMSNMFIRNNAFAKYNYGQNTQYKPQVGNIIFYEWANRADGPDHVGIIVNVSGNTISVIEGNKPNDSKGVTEVGLRTLNYRDTSYWASHIYGWGTPDYGANSQSSEFIGPIDTRNNATTVNQTMADAIISDEDLGYEIDFNTYYDEYLERYNKKDGNKQENAFFTNKELSKFRQINNLRGIIGLPPQFTPTTDTRLAFAEDEDGNVDMEAALNQQYLGTDYASSITTKMPLVYFTPCEPVFLPSLKNSKQKTAMAAVIQKLAGDMAPNLEDMVGNYSGKIYSTKYAYADYFKYVNPMCRIMAKFLGLTETYSPYRKAARDLKVTTYNWGRNYMESTIDEMKEIFDKYEKADTEDNLFRDIIYHRTAIPFYANMEPSVQEEFSNETTQSSLNSKVNSMSDTARELQYILGMTTSQIGLNFDKLKDNLAASKQSLDDFVSKLPVGGNVFSVLVNSLNTVISGGRLIFPEIWSDSDFSRSYNINMRLISPSPDNLSIWRHILVPLAHVYGLVCPRQADKHGYSAPFLVKVFCKGMYNIDMGIVTGVTVTKGKENTWNKDGLPTYVDVSITVKDLYKTLSITSMSDTKFDTMNNIAEMDFLANACGINFSVPDTKRYIEMFMLMNGLNRIYDSAGNVGNNLTNWGLNKASNLIMAVRSIRGAL